MIKDIKSVCYSCTLWIGTHGALSWSETNVYNCIISTYYSVCTSLENAGIKNRPSITRHKQNKATYSDVNLLLVIVFFLN